VGNQARHLRNARFFNVAMPEGTRVRLLTGEWITVTGAQKDRRPYPQVRPNWITTSDGVNYYNSLQAKLERQFRNGFALSTGYTWARAFGLNYGGSWFSRMPYEFDRRNTEKGPLDYERVQSYYASAIWQLPLFRNADGWASRLLGGWELSPIITLASGSPFGVVVGRDLWDQGPRKVIRADRVSTGQLPEDQRTVDRFFDTSAFQIPCCNRLGNASHASLRTDGLALVDLSLHKAFRIAEGKTFDFRVDMFNAFNHPIFTTPDATADSPSFGQVLGTGDPRNMQLGFRFTF